jgi:hypothetical protein
VNSNIDNPDHMHDPRGGVQYPLLHTELWRRLDFSSLATSRGVSWSYVIPHIECHPQTAVSITSGHCTSGQVAVISTITVNIVDVIEFIDVGIFPQVS